ncbi:MAG: pantetheine-phosphate adenylyltransferase [Paludibacteraceae bacterium]|nr:pantetheine-phosphate adenylyltransferase [Paludibacteraceae bacterium]MBQ6962474.1 pantetheine-phosphate adenylyltransferase [Paludibacteraceae bacterium]
MKKAIFPGSFDPFTIGHFSVVKRGLELFDHITIGVGSNCSKKSYFTLEKRLDIIRQAFHDEPRVSVKAYNSLTIDFAKEEEANFILRGVRSANDFEYEKSIADINKRLSSIETVLLFTEPQHSAVSSTIVRDLLSYGKDVAEFLPPDVVL